MTATSFPGIQQPEAKETTVQTLNRIANERLVTLEGLCNRLESFADRMEPLPKPVGATSAAQSPVSNDLQGLQNRMSSLGERLDWLSQICNRLDRIA